MPRYSILVAVQEIVYGMSYYAVEVNAEDEMQARELAIQKTRQGEDVDFIGFEGDDSETHWLDVELSARAEGAIGTGRPKPLS